MSLRQTTRHRARLAAMRRIQEILAEQAELYAWYPDLRPDPRRPGVVPHDGPHRATRQIPELGVGHNSRVDRPLIPGHSTKKYWVS